MLAWNEGNALGFGYAVRIAVVMEQVVDGDVVELRQGVAVHDIRDAVARFPFGHGLAGDNDYLGHLLDGQAAAYFTRYISGMR